MNKFYMAMMPAVFGHGITCFSQESEADALAKVERAYNETLAARMGKPRAMPFAERFEYYGGRTQEMMWDKTYDDNCA
tara:strand:- start:1910 stop:2143 length:234 start_codon:yes stop_codon:yes gene_type:complete